MRSAPSPATRARPRCSRCSRSCRAGAESKPRDYVIVLDGSQSMVGERFTRATELARRDDRSDGSPRSLHRRSCATAMPPTGRSALAVVGGATRARSVARGAAAGRRDAMSSRRSAARAERSCSDGIARAAGCSTSAMASRRRASAASAMSRRRSRTPPPAPTSTSRRSASAATPISAVLAGRGARRWRQLPRVGPRPDASAWRRSRRSSRRTAARCATRRSSCPAGLADVAPDDPADDPRAAMRSCSRRASPATCRAT